MDRSTFEILLSEDVQKILNDFSSLFGIRIAFFSAQGGEVRVGLGWPSSRFCTLLRDKLGLIDTCHACDQRQRKKAVSRGKMLAYTCHAGMLEAIVPVTIDGTLIGYIMMGQVRQSSTISPHIRKAWQKVFGNNLQLENAFNDLPLFALAKKRSVLSLFSILVDYIIAKTLITVKRNLLVEKIIAFIDAHEAEPIRIESIARFVAKSPTTITHFFKHETGQSLKSFILERKMHRAEELMSRKDQISIAEIARQVGFEDQFHFSRTFSKYRGMAPAVFRASIH